MDAQRLYSERSDAYLRFVALFRYAQGLRAFLSASSLLRENMRVLDAGCGSGLLSRALMEALQRHAISGVSIQGFDLTPEMLERFQEHLRHRQIDDIDLCRADVRTLDQALPASWSRYDLLMSAAMLEYLSAQDLPQAIASLRRRLAPGGVLLLFITRSNLVTRWLIGRKWQAHCYRREDLRLALQQGGMTAIEFRRFPLPYWWLNVWGHVVVATSAARDEFSQADNSEIVARGAR